MYTRRRKGPQNASLKLAGWNENNVVVTAILITTVSVRFTSCCNTFMSMRLLFQLYRRGGNLRLRECPALAQGHVAPALDLGLQVVTLLSRALHYLFGMVNLLIKIKLLKAAMYPKARDLLAQNEDHV